MSYTVAPAIKRLLAELNATYPKRDRTSDGTIGDAAHARRKSEHNPNADPNDDVPDGMVTALDIDKDGIDIAHVLSRLIGADRVWYVIWDRHIYSRTFRWEKNPYVGDDPHTSHIHVSLEQHEHLLNDTSSWGIAVPAKPVSAPVPKETPYQRVSRIAHQRKVRIANLLKRLGK